MSDDGLIVLRTVRNVLAGDGPVFNAGERVEANTSTLWQYLITVVGWVSGARLEYVALALALFLTVAAVVLSTLSAGRFWGGAVLPFGAIIYLALPPARDFATSGLEWGLSLFWLAAWWALLVAWSRPFEDRPVTARRRHGRPSREVAYLLAFWSGLSWLVRPELALYGAATIVVLLTSSLLAPRDLRKAGLILLSGLPLPAAYEVFRMGYYGLLTPHTAVAKSAAEAEWGRGFAYAWNFLSPYALWAPLLVAAVLGVRFFAQANGRELGRPLVVVLLAVGCALAHTLYVIRVGGDFMHGRMLLLPLFALLLPVAAVPARRITAVAVIALALWAAVVIERGHPLPGNTRELTAEELNIVDEREFWTMATNRTPGHPPLVAQDFLGSKLMDNWVDKEADARASNAGQMMLARISEDPETYGWFTVPRKSDGSDLSQLAATAYLINLGMTGENASLETRVLDTVGLATPLAARMPREEGGRVGHDKSLAVEWQVADSATDLSQLPSWVDREKAMQARAALRSPDIAALISTYRDPLTLKRFGENMRYALTEGRTLTLDDDPATYLDASTLERIEAGEDVGWSAGR